jgi:hypothetical protein
LVERCRKTGRKLPFLQRNFAVEGSPFCQASKNKWRKSGVSEKWCEKVCEMCKKYKVRLTTISTGVVHLILLSESHGSDGCSNDVSKKVTTCIFCLFYILPIEKKQASFFKVDEMIQVLQ